MTATKVAITGAGGFVGRHLAPALRDAHTDWTFSLPGLPGQPGGLDITDATGVEHWITQERPQVVVHLAAIAAVTDSVKDPRQAWTVNLDGTLNLVLALQKHAPEAHLLFVSSAEVYGQSLIKGEAVDEIALLQPVNPYAASKAAADILVRQAGAGGMAVTVARPFNHTGPGQSDAFVAPNFAAQIARIEAGLQAPVIEVGSLDDERDFLDVADVIAAYQLLLERRAYPDGQGVFNVASGDPVRIGDILERLLSFARLKIEVRVDRSRLRRTPVPRVIGDASRLRSLGWRPQCALEQTLKSVLEHERTRIRPQQSQGLGV
jgi:GDP-4-dehydro-6-deoxy-D-mannose reductase